MKHALMAALVFSIAPGAHAGAGKTIETTRTTPAGEQTRKLICTKS